MIAGRLRIGDTIGIVSPSHLGTAEYYERCIAGLESLGFRAKPGENIYRDTHGYLASEQERADDMNAMVRDDQVRMILFGGGEGGNEVLPYLDYAAIERSPKIFCSYSDGTTILNAVHSRTGLVTYYGQAPGTFSDLRHYDYTQFASTFLDPEPSFARSGKWHVLNPGSCEGVLTGGYTRNYALLQGSRYFAFDASSPYVLFLEDHEKFSDVAAVSSYLSHIEQSDLIHCVTGLLFGHYSDTPSPDLLSRLERFGRRHDVPVAYCDDFGHGANHAILPIGMRAKLDVDRATLCYDPG
jgi:muramoyltetrapeptide carboxypeptidase